MIGKVLKGFKGQKQKWFLMEFNGNDEDFNLNNHTPEFDEWRWCDLKTMPSLVVDFKKPLYEKLVEIFLEKIEEYKIN